MIPVLMTLIAARVFFSDSARLPVRKAIGARCCWWSIRGFSRSSPKPASALLERSRSNGGAVGYVVEGALASILNTIGAAIVLTVASVLTLMLTMEVSLVTVGGGLTLDQGGAGRKPKRETNNVSAVERSGGPGAPNSDAFRPKSWRRRGPSRSDKKRRSGAGASARRRRCWRNSAKRLPNSASARKKSARAERWSRSSPTQLSARAPKRARRRIAARCGSRR